MRYVSLIGDPIKPPKYPPGTKKKKARNNVCPICKRRDVNIEKHIITHANEEKQMRLVTRIGIIGFVLLGAAILTAIAFVLSFLAVI